MKIRNLNILKNGAKSGASLLFAGIIALSASGNANAGNIGIDLNLGNGNAIHFDGKNVHYRKHKSRHHSRHYKHRRNQYHDQYRPQSHRQVCGPRRAVNKAYRLGLNHPQVHRVKDRRIVVSGYQYGHRAKMVFKRHSRCQLIKTVRTR